MLSVWGMLGYDEVAESLAESLNASTKTCVLEGPPGVGKSWLARDLGALWESRGGSTVLIEGDQLRADASLYPFAFAMGGLPSRWGSMGPAITGVATAAEVLAGTGGLITATVRAAASSRKLRRRDRSMFIGDSEQVILHELERLAKRRPLLLIADNVHWWDTSSLGLLGRITDERIWEAFPFLSEMRVLAVQTVEPYQSVSNPQAHELLLTPSRTRHFPLRRIPREGFEGVLEALGSGSAPPADVTSAVHLLSGGHLALASRCADRLSKDEASVFLAASNAEDFLEDLLTERVLSLGTRGKEAIAMLQIAALLGSTFRRDEVCCAAGRDDGETLELMRYCRGEGFLEVADGLDRFVHDIYRTFFLQRGGSDPISISEKLSDCLRLSRPSEYELRCVNAINAEDLGTARALAVHAAMQAEREGRSWEQLPTALRDMLTTGEGREMVERLTSAHRLLRNSCFSGCMAELDRLPRRLTKSLAAESDYLRALCLMSTRSERDRARARLILEGWEGYAEEEPEIGTRLILLLLYGLFHVPDKTRGWELEARIGRSLAARAAFDRAAEDALYVLDRNAGGLHPPDAALVRVREAVAHFGPRRDQRVLRRPVEYYRSQVNLAAKLIENGDYDEACEVGRAIDRLVDQFEPGVFACIQWPRTNQIQAEYRCGACDAQEAARRQREIVRQHAMGDDPYYAENALAVYLALAGELDVALSTLDRLNDKFAQERADPEPSMRYLLGANQCAVRFLTGEIASARSEWLALTDTASASNYTDRDVLLLRHELMTDVIDAEERMTAAEFDRCLIERHPDRFGPLWRNFGHGFVLPALEFWRDS